MQLVRLLYPVRTRHWWGKINQIYLAIGLEIRFSKKQILELYLNRIPFGGNIEGVASAAWLYYGKSLSHLTENELDALVQIPQNPARASKLSRLPLPFHAPHFVQNLILHAPPRDNFSSTLDLNLQKQLERVISKQQRNLNNLGVTNAAALLVDWKTQETRAWIGSANFFDNEISGQTDGVLAQRSPGSTLKPFLYALAMDEGIIHPESLLKDAPISIGVLEPENFDREFFGPIGATRALVLSRNIPAIEIYQQLKQPSFSEFLKQGGLHVPKPDDYYGHLLPLGGVETSLYQLVKWYAALATGGNLKEIYSQSSLESNRSPIDKNRKNNQKWLTAESSFLVLDMLTSNDRGQTSRVVWSKDLYPMAWKTGTSNGSKDAWTIGVFGNYVLGIWLGNFDGSSNTNLIGRELAAPIFFSMANSIYQFELQLTSNEEQRVQLEESYFRPHWRRFHHLNVKKVKVCALSGAIPNSTCPHLKQTWFIPGHSPVKPCDVHRRLLVDRLSGLRACQNSVRKNLVEAVFEFWPSDLGRIFKQAGLSRRDPPKWSPECRFLGDGSGNGPVIVSPRNGVEYVLPDHTKHKTIPLLAKVDGETRKLKWFIDEEFIAEGNSNNPIEWQARDGAFTLRAIDEFGRADAQKLVVRSASKGL